MHDVFISYAREDRPLAERLAAVLQAQGWSVWWDRDIPSGKAFDRVIEEALAGARCVIVLWSAESIDSRWVRAEAAEGLRRDCMLPIMIGDVLPPLAFRRIHAESLTDWDGPMTPSLEKILRDVSGVIEKPLPHLHAAGSAGASTPSVPRRRVIFALAVLLLASGAAVASWVWSAQQARAGLLGRWGGEVRYSWGPVVAEQFEFSRRDGQWRGTGTFLGGKRSLLELQQQGRTLSFVIRWSELMGGQERAVTNYYVATADGDVLTVLMHDDRGYPPVEFTLAGLD